MPFDYESATTAVVNALNGYNTTTSTPDLSAGMTRRVRAVYRTDPEIFNPRGDVFPVVLVRIVVKEVSSSFLYFTTTLPLAGKASCIMVIP